ncbi:MAG: penicillin acylase family protein [Gemmatimonadaceae bacterium]|nr:penicillin acylase family protein [Gemmatimonadaceae bacterium]
MTAPHAPHHKGEVRVGIPTVVTNALSLIALGGALWVGFRPTASVPPLGQLLDPAHGIWAAARVAELPAEQAITLDGLGQAVEVRYDDRGVPHIFASTVADAVRALGWVHARDRLFQMELTARKVEGTISELAGAQALPLDRQSRQRGLVEAARARWNAVPQGSETRTIVEAYIEGINQWVRDSDPSDWPVEYKLLGARPRIFQAEDTYKLLAEMSQVLAWQSEELDRAAVEALVGRAATDALFPVNAPIQEPIEPVPGRHAPRYADVTLPAPEMPTPRGVAEARRAVRTLAQLALEASPTRGEAVVGSNNWAVAPARTAAGHALLSGDPHLQLTLPSIWYEAHLVVPGQLEVYGVTFPLAPVVPIGFNREVAWTATNTGADVLDFYREVVDDTVAPTKYRVDGQWRDLVVREERYRGKQGEVLAVDTLRRTHRGPLLRTESGWLSMRWTALEPSDEATAFWGAMRATSAEEWYRAMESYKAPAQNFLVADRRGSIGIRSTGRYPIRPGDGRGDRIFDGATSASDWIGDWPVARYPQALRPAQGYLASNNQQPLDPQVRPGYLGWDWPNPWRALRINQILRADSAMTPEKMQAAQTDPISAMTAPLVERVRAAVQADPNADEATREAMAFLDAWDQRFTLEAKGALLFSALVDELQRRTWDEFTIPGEDRRVVTPGSMLLMTLMRDNTSPWWDVRATTGTVETRDAVLVQSLKAAWEGVRARRGTDPQAWRWGDVRQASIRHLLQLPGFGRESLAVQSGPGTLSPNDGRGIHGASWRFVVELGDAVRAWGTYPGGQSGNPVSSRYDDRVELWRKGELAPLRLPHTAAEVTGAQLTSVVRFTPLGGAR